MGTAVDVEKALGRDLDIVAYLKAVLIVARRNKFVDFAEACERAIAEIERLRSLGGSNVSSGRYREIGCGRKDRRRESGAGDGLL
ncbi:MAG: hypothetical protein A2Y76_01555 [Planctomycetes bacterium RBG_13_60_9]|nr:MAG: hypothetical protein A2Y76_01555 [Planctomycetes bacterium RBG_13_60_9]